MVFRPHLLPTLRSHVALFSTNTSVETAITAILASLYRADPPLWLGVFGLSGIRVLGLCRPCRGR